jgi:hypothetical protein
MSPWLKEFAATNDLKGMMLRTARIIITFDATASRQPTWDAAASLTGRMFDVVAGLGKLWRPS